MKHRLTRILVVVAILAQPTEPFVLPPRPAIAEVPADSNSSDGIPKAAARAPRCNESKRRTHARAVRAGRALDRGTSDARPAGPTRRRVLGDILLLSGAQTTATIGTIRKASAMQNSQTTVFDLGRDMTLEEAKARFKEGQKSLEYLLGHYDEICEGGGDNVRRYLGTVGTSSGLYGISKVMKVLQSEAGDMDVVEFTECMETVNSALRSADGSAYATIFTVTSPTGNPPERAKKYFGDARTEANRAMDSMNGIAKQMNIR